ncbi:MAG: nickel pincer cofactor biosynthesis protein LarC, partial [Eubacteriales bacterium]|nr:nickel pincer cofactor biosynthesis protein LarC [Eubacteriales bacterium]
EFSLTCEKTVKQGISGTKADVLLAAHEEHDHDHAHDHTHEEHGHDHAHDHTHEEHLHAHGAETLAIAQDHVHTQEAAHSHEHHHRGLHEIEHIIGDSDLHPLVKEKALEMFRELAKAEAKVHGTTPDQVHFHEVGAVDSIVDIVGTCVCMWLLGADEIQASAVNTGSGTVKCAHGIMPVPAPATAELLTGLLCYSNGTLSELTTPTGALIIRSFAKKQGALPQMKIEKIGYGFGTKEFLFANCVRAVLGTSQEQHGESVLVMQANVDDMTGEAASYCAERLMDAGALDVFFSPIYMKKGRPAFLLQVICREGDRQKMENVLFAESTTLGVRWQSMQRTALEREIISVETQYGTLPIKQRRWNGTLFGAPEYGPCADAARKNGVPLQVVYQAVTEKFYEK